MARKRLFTSESVSMGHPDKMADQISDAILDAIIARDKAARVACETLVTTGMAVVVGEISTSCYVHVPDIVRQTIKEIGYTDASMGFDYRSCAVLTTIDTQSPDIAMGVNEGEGHEQGAGDQGMMLGYATNETLEMMPLPLMLSRRLTDALASARQSQSIPWLRPDGKSQVTVEYEDDEPKRIAAVVVSTQHHPDIDHATIRETVISEIIRKNLPGGLLDSKTAYHVNPTGRFAVGGPMGDAGLTGRKIIVDTYGGMGSHGGGCFSGKDPSKVDRSAAYRARHVAKNIVAAELADRCEVQLAYVIGVAEPVSVYVNTFGTGTVDEEKIEKAVREVFSLKPRRIIEELNLLRPIYKETARFGHFGRTGENYTWEKTDKVEALKTALKLCRGRKGEA